MLLQITLIALAVTFSSSNSNQSSYSYHSTFTQYSNSFDLEVNDYDEDESYLYTCWLKFDGDLWFNGSESSSQLGNREWYLSYNTITLYYDTYYFNSSNYEQLAHDSSITYVSPNYSLEGSGNALYLKSDGTGNIDSLKFYFSIDVSETVLEFSIFEARYGQAEVFIWNGYSSLPQPAFNLNNFSVVYKWMYGNGPAPYQYINSVLGGSSGYSDGYSAGYNNGYNNGSRDGYSEGYSDGLEVGITTNSTAFTIFNGILQIALVPINFFLAIFNWEILGINISEFVSALLSICCLIILLRVVFNGGSKND